ncbi:putative ABC transporter ATP-binding protein YrbF [Proteus mirabilis]|uniref:Putative ABC transporter ATP-binding protein YrbF n=1 Tax=Proteus mirabilis TaxID=584 RepID=A0A2X2C3F2_PROMI|nr:putative ABC transporter ATP-binding protein YrbF [Proteus mirabilis]
MNAQPDNLIEVRNMNFTRGSRKIFSQINLDVPRGKVTAIMGPSGIGKTTLLRLMGGQILPDSGDIWFDGDNIPKLSRSALYQSRKKNEYAFSIRRPFY